MFYPWHGVRTYWLSMLSNFNQRCIIDSPLTNNFHYVKEVTVWDNRKCIQNIKKHLIIFVRKRFARGKTQSTQGLPTLFDWKCLTRYSSSLIVKFVQPSQKTAEMLTPGYRSYFHKKLQELMQVKLIFLTYQYFMVNW